MEPQTKRRLLHHGSFVGAIWSMLYGMVQLIVLGLSYPDLNEKRYHQDNMQVPYYGGGVDPYRQSMPGLYNRYLNMPERRRITALYILHISLIALSALHLIVTTFMVYGVIKFSRNFIWPWFPISAILSVLSVAYSVVWWSGDCFRMWQTIALFEFLTSVPVNAIVLGVVFVYYLHMVNYFDDHGQPAKYAPGELAKSRSQLSMNHNAPISQQGHMVTGAASVQYHNQTFHPTPQYSDPAGLPMGGPPARPLPPQRQQPQVMYSQQHQYNQTINEPPPNYTPWETQAGSMPHGVVMPQGVPIQQVAHQQPVMYQSQPVIHQQPPIQQHPFMHQQPEMPAKRGWQTIS